MGIPSFTVERTERTLKPRHWQSHLIQLLRARLVQSEPGGHDVLVHAGPGAGKTIGALLSFQTLLRERRLDRFLVFCHRMSIAEQWQQAASRLGLRLLPWDHTASLDPGGWDGQLISYQGAGRHRDRLQQLLPQLGLGRWLAIADEVHHLGLDPDEPEAAGWGHAFSQLTVGAQLRLGLTGTPFRADNLAFCAARRLRIQQGDGFVEQIEPDLCVEPRQLIEQGDVRPLEFRFQDGWVDHGRRNQSEPLEPSPLSVEHRESWRARNLRRAIQLTDPSGIARVLLQQARGQLEQVRVHHPGAAGMVVARDIAHARTVTDFLEAQGDRAMLVHSQAAEAPAALAAFREGTADWLVSIDMCAEGFDAPRVRVVAYLTTVVTRSRFVQAITRAVRVDATRAALEEVPRHPSYIYAVADPLLISHARGWSLREPYEVRARSLVEEGVPGQPGPPSRPLEALGERTGEIIRMKGPELPSFLRRSA
ncbi:MAG: DEAD/DEAH box helicase family protein [Cyanobacteriota bacterium]|nr:DEAD/DEAH box helicase family protein [Cyanobacteriota bacterium]